MDPLTRRRAETTWRTLTQPIVVWSHSTGTSDGLEVSGTMFSFSGLGSIGGPTRRARGCCNFSSYRLSAPQNTLRGVLGRRDLHVWVSRGQTANKVTLCCDPNVIQALRSVTDQAVTH
jgi:hypothetical protein